MSVTEVSLMGVGTTLIPGNNTPDNVWEVGSAVEVAPGVYLTAAHVLYDTIPNPVGSDPPNLAVTPTFSSFAINANSISFSSVNLSWVNPVVNGGSTISNFNNPTNYRANLATGVPGGNDISSFTAASAGTPTGVILFENPTSAVMQKYFPNVSFTGFVPSAISSQGLVTETSTPSPSNSIVQLLTNQTFELSGTLGGQGTSGAGVWGTYGGNNYVLGTVLGVNSTGNALASYITPAEFYSVFPLQGTLSTTTHNLIVGSSSGSNDMRGSFQTTDIIGAGNSNLILAGGNGDTINPGVGTNNIMFSSTLVGADSLGTTYVLGAGSNEIDGGSPNDKLVLLADRLSSTTNADPTGSAISATSPTIQLLGGWGSIPGSTFGGYTVPAMGYYSLDTGENAAGVNSTNETAQLLGNYAYIIDYAPGYGSDGKEDLEIDIIAYNLAYNTGTGTGPVVLWEGQTLINDYQPGDFGLTLVQTPDYEEAVTGQISPTQYEADQQALTLAQMASPVTPTYVDDDPTATWLGLQNQGPTPSDSPSTLAADLKLLLAATGASTSGQVSVAGFLSNQSVLDAAGGIAISDLAVNVSANFNALNSDANVTSISLTDSGTPTLTLSSAQALDDTSALGKIANSNYTITISDTSANVAANFSALNADSRVTAITLTDGPTPELMLTAAQGTSDQTALKEVANANFAVNYTGVSGQTYTSYEDIYAGGGLVADAEELSAGGSELIISGNGVTVSSTSSGTTVSADSTTFALGSSYGVVSAIALLSGATATVGGAGDPITVNSGDNLSVTGTGDTVTVEGTGDTVAISAGSVTLWSGSSATITGNSDSIVAYASDSVSASGTGDNAALEGSGDSITISSGSVTVWSGESATISGNSNSIVAYASDSVSATGTGDNAALEGSGDSITVSSGSVTVWSGESATIAGNNDSITAYASDTVSATGTGDSAWIDGAGDNITLSSGSVGLANGSSATVNGSGDSLTLYSGATVSATGTGDSAWIQGTGNNLTLSSASIGLSNGSSATVSGSGNSLTLYGGDTVSATGTGDSAWVEGTGNSLTLSSGSVGLSSGSSATVNGSGISLTLYGGDSASAIGTSDSAWILGTGNSLTLSSGSVGLSNASSATVNGSTDTITVSGNNTLSVSGNNDTIVFSGSSTVTASGTGETYDFASGDGQGVIGAASGSNTGVIAFGSGLSDEKLWLVKVGNNLQIDLLGSSNTLTVDDWFGGAPAAIVQQLTAGGLKLDAQVGTLVNAMASYAASNPSFNPTTATQMPTNSSLQTAIAAAWHS